MTGLLARVALLPRNIVVGLLRLYRLAISPIYGDVCRYHPTCSAYGLGAVQQHGILGGGVLTLKRIGRCHPWAAGGIDDVPTKRGFRFVITPGGFVDIAGTRKV